MSYYETAQVCVNGHMITDSIERKRAHTSEFCSKCGCATITTCPKCGEPIRGHYHVDGVVVVGGSTAIPSYCFKCGTAFPWTQSAIESLSCILEEDDIAHEEVDRMLQTLPDLMSETPKTQLAVSRTKRILLSAGKFTGDAIRQFLIDFGCEVAKTQLGLK